MQIHPLNLSTMVRYEKCPMWKQSAQTCSNGYVGDSIRISGSGGCDGAFLMQSWHVAQWFSILESRPGQYTHWFAWNRICVTPWLVEWRLFKITLLNEQGMTRRWSRRATPSKTDKRWWTSQNSWRCAGSVSLCLLGNLVVMIWRRSWYWALVRAAVRMWSKVTFPILLTA